MSLKTRITRLEHQTVTTPPGCLPGLNEPEMRKLEGFLRAWYPIRENAQQADKLCNSLSESERWMLDHREQYTAYRSFLQQLETKM